MKKTLITVLSVVLSNAAFSQTKNTTDFGVTIGYNAATVTNSNLSADYRSGLNAGLAVEHYFSDSWSFKGKVLYDQKGWSNGYLNTATSSIVTNYNLDYITVPLLANWHFGKTKNWYLNFGPYVAFLLNANATANNIDVKKAFNSTDGGLDIGIGVKFPVATNTKFFIEFNGQGGVANLYNNTSSSTIRSSVSAFNIGLNFK